MQYKTNLLQSILGRPGRNFRMCWVIILICALFYSQLVGCAAITLSPYEPPSMDAMSKSQNQENLLIAVHPLTDGDEQVKYFGKDLTSVGIMPILIVASNGNTYSSFVIDEKNITMGIPSEKYRCPRPAKAEAASTTTGESMAIVGGLCLLLLPPGIVPYVFLAPSGAKSIADATIVQNALVESGLYTHTVSPEKTVSGFVFFKIPKGQENLENLIMNVPALELGSSKVYNFEFLFN